MNRVIRIALLCTLAVTAGTASIAQKRSANKAARKVPTTATKVFCEGDSIPKGYVIVGYKSSVKCGDKSQLVISKIGSARRTARRADDSAIARAFATRTSDIQVEGEGTVIRILPDDLRGSRHQRFIVQLASGQTLLITHNIDLAPRIAGLAIGDSVRFYGEYVWNEKGGVIHWTHHDPKGRHVAGWIKHKGKTFQ